MAEDSNTKKTTVITPKGRLSFPHLFKPHAGIEGAEPKYSCTILFAEGEDLSGLKAAATAAAKAKWGDKVPPKLRSPFLDQGEYQYDGHVPGAVMIRTASKRPPGVMDRTGKQHITEEQEMYPGCYVRLQVNAYAYDQAGNRGISFGLNHVQKLAEGEPLGGFSKAEDAFEAVDGEDVEDMFA